MPNCPRCNEDVALEDARCAACGTDLRIRGSRPGDVVLVLDRGLFQFFKYVFALVAFALVVGAFFLGFDLKNLVQEMGDRRDELVDEKRVLDDLILSAALTIDDLKTQAASAETDFSEARKILEDRVENVQEQVNSMNAAVRQAELMIETIRTRRVQTENIYQEMLSLSADGFLLVQNVTTQIRTDRIRSRDRLWVNGTRLYYGFLNEVSEDTKQIIAGVVREWSIHANIQFQYTEDVDSANIRIGLKQGEGSWSYIGRDSISLPEIGEPTMNLGWAVTDRIGRDTVLHQFGHVLGFLHEHQNANLGIEWNETAVYEFFSEPPNNWTDSQIEFNILRKIGETDYPCARIFDPNSIMTYSFPAALMNDGVAIMPTPGLSESDKSCAREMYPRI